MQISQVSQVKIKMNKAVEGFVFMMISIIKVAGVVIEMIVAMITMICKEKL